MISKPQINTCKPFRMRHTNFYGTANGKFVKNYYRSLAGNTPENISNCYLYIQRHNLEWKVTIKVTYAEGCLFGYSSPLDTEMSRFINNFQLPTHEQVLEAVKKLIASTEEELDINIHINKYETE